jgi:hypothetical protein
MNPRFKAPLYPFEAIINPGVDVFIQYTNYWIDNDYHIFSASARDKYKQMNIGALAALCFPVVTHFASIQPLARWILWGIMLDDYYEPCSVSELQDIRRHLMAILEGKQPGPQDNGIYRQAAALRDDLKALMPDTWMKRFIVHQDTQLAGMIQESPYKLDKRFPSLEDYIRIRELSVAIYPMLDLLEVQEGTVLPDTVVTHPAVLRLARLATRLTAWLNDLYTLPKELLRENDPFNLVLVLQRERALSLEDAYTAALQIHDADLEEFLLLEASLPDFGTYRAAVRNYVRDMGLMLRGQQTWYEQYTTRYAPGGYVESEYKTNHPG